MSTSYPPPDDPADVGPPPNPEPAASHDEILDRPKEVGRRITELVKRLTGDTDPEHRVLPTDDTETHPPVP